jgi:NADH:ubiquinone oxidoreductase subunit E
MVDPPEERVIYERTLLEWLPKALQNIFGYISETTKTYVAHILGLVKSYWPRPIWTHWLTIYPLIALTRNA